MATPRKRHFNVADSIYREPWPHNVKLALVMLSAYLNTRWARDAIPHAEAGRATLSPGDVLNITGSGTLRSGRAVLTALGKQITLELRWEGEFSHVDWPKFAEFQGYGARLQGSLRGSRPAPSRTPSASASASLTPEKRERALIEDPPPEVESEAERWANVLSKEPGTREAKLAFLDHDLVRIKDEVIADLAPGKRDKEAVRAKTRSKIVGWWRQRLKNPRGPTRGRSPEMPPRIRETAGDLLSLPPVPKAKREKNAAQAREMVAGLSKGRAMPEVR